MKKSKTDTIMNIAAVMCAALIALATALAVFASARSFPYAKGKQLYRDFSSDWEFENGETARLEKIDGDCVLHKEVPQLSDDMLLSFHVRNLDIEVFVDDECIYTQNKPDDPFLKGFFGKSSGSDFVELLIHKEYYGRTLYINVTCPYSNTNNCKIVDMYLGDGVSIVKHNASVQLGEFCFSILIFFIGVVCIILYLPMRRHKMVDSSMLYLGMMALAFGEVMITDCKMLPLVVGLETLYYTTSQMFMVLIPMPLLLFFAKLYGDLNRKLVAALCFIDAADFAAILALNALGVADYCDNAVMVLAVCAISILYIGAVTVRRMVKHGDNKTFHNIGVILLALAVVLDTLAVRVWYVSESSFFMRFGLAGFTCFEFVQILWTHIQNYQKSVKSQIVSRLAYYDGLTEMLNRTSFMEDMKKLEDERRDDVLFAVFDVNNLKYVNDNFGHSGGDELIISVADCIGKAFGELGKCYRVGGDEFVLISVGENSEQRFTEAEEKLHSLIDEVRKQAEYPVSVAVGYSAMNSRKCTLKELFDEADGKMYVNKREMKERAVLA